MENAVPLIAIHQRLQAKLPNLDDQLKWLGKSNPAFDGHKPIEIAASSLENLYWVSYTLDSLHLEKESAPARATPGNPP